MFPPPPPVTMKHLYLLLLLLYLLICNVLLSELIIKSLFAFCLFVYSDVVVFASHSESRGFDPQPGQVRRYFLRLLRVLSAIQISK